MSTQLMETLKAKKSLQLQKAKLILDTCERETRALTPEEETAHAAILADVDAMSKRLDTLASDESTTAQIAALTGGLRPGSLTAGANRSLGAQWVESTAGTFFLKGQHRGSRSWASPVVELSAATLTSDPASGGKLIVSDYRPGVVPIAQRPLTIAELLAQGTTTSNTVTYMKETSFMNAAAPTAEGAAKPESTLAFDQVMDPVQKIAHWLPVTEEMLEDAEQIQSYIDSRLRLGVELSVDEQLLNGDGTPPNLMGLLNRVGLAAPIARGATETNADAIYRQVVAIETATAIRPMGIVMHPSNWAAIQLLKATDGTYISGLPPFASPQGPTLWGLPVAVTSAIALGEALVGFGENTAQIFYRGQLRVEASNSHSDYWVRNLVAIRAERRLALAVYRPAAYGLVTALT